MTALEPLEWLCGFKHALVANRAARLEPLRNTVMLVISKRNTRIAPHAMPVVDSKSFPNPADVAKWTMENVFVWSIIVEIAQFAEVLCERSSL